MGENKSGSVKKIAIIIIIAIIVIVGVFIAKRGKNNLVVDSSKYQAVFLSNGQTYFGNVVNPNEKYVSLTNVYYLVLKQPLQNQNNTDQNQSQTAPEYSLIKLGKELHGPTSMSINKDQILFIENLADDSKVVITIKNTQK